MCNCFEFGPSVQEQKVFKRFFSKFCSGGHFIQQSKTALIKGLFGKGHYKEHLSEIILNFGQRSNTLPLSHHPPL